MFFSSLLHYTLLLYLLYFAVTRQNSSHHFFFIFCAKLCTIFRSTLFIKFAGSTHIHCSCGTRTQNKKLILFASTRHNNNNNSLTHSPLHCRADDEKFVAILLRDFGRDFKLVHTHTHVRGRPSSPFVSVSLQLHHPPGHY